MTGPQPGPNGFAYMPQQGMPPQGMYPPPNGPMQPHAHAMHAQMQHAPMPQAPMHPQMQGPPNYQYPGPQQHHQQHHLQPQFIEEQRRSMPPAFPQQEQMIQRSPQPPPQQLPLQPSPQPLQKEEPPSDSAEMLQAPVKRMSKSRSIFTPIDESRSILSQHWASSTSAPDVDPATGRAQSADVGAISRQTGASVQPLQRAQMHDKARNISQSSLPETTFTPPSRTNSAQLNAKRPRLKVQIPDEPSDGGSNTAGSSPPGSTATGTNAVRTDGSHSSSGVVLPPPSPSASALLSAGASGPPNPFARPHPPGQSQQSQVDRKDTIETPMSALPSRFMSNEFLPSPSSFFNTDYGTWKSDGNTLPSPMNFSTPVMGFGSSFLREDSGGASAGGAGSTDGAAAGKRKSPEIKAESDPKRLKTEA